MSRLFYHVTQDNAGNLLFDVSGTMRLAGSGTLATIYGDEGLTVILPNPMTNHPSFGSFKCFLGAGDYDFYMAKSGYTFETLTGVQGHGTMAQQNADAVAITGGTAALTSASVGWPSQATYDLTVNQLYNNGRARFGTNVGIGTDPVPGSALTTGPDLVVVNGNTQINAQVALFSTPTSNVRFKIEYLQSGFTYGQSFKPTDTDAGSGAAIVFLNFASDTVGSIKTTNSATAYNTISDGRLKKLVETLTGELDAIQALRPVRFHWLADNSPGYGFIASEVQQALPDANIITGTTDATNEDGTINPQMIDHSKLVVWLVGACKTLAAKLEAAEARLAILEDALGV